MKLLKVDGLSVFFGGLKALDGVTFSVEIGEVLGIVGPNGAGKSTLFNAVLGVVPKNKGRISFRGQDITRLRTSDVARLGIIRTFQHTTIFQGLSLYESVLIGATRQGRDTVGDILLRSRRHRESEKMLRKEVEEVLRFCGLYEKKDELGRNLPYGDQRLVEIAIALAAKPELLMLDEPAAGLNPAEKQEFRKLVHRIRERGITVILVEHDMPLVMDLCDRLIVLNHGVLIAEGNPQKVAADPLVVEAYLGGATSYA
ncbi:ABC transporter ATP-binding protein [Moorellaceae bacterium AZ2]